MTSAVFRRVDRVVFAGLVRLIRLLPGPRAVRVAGRLFGWVSFLTVPDWHRRIAANLALVYGPQLPARQRRAIHRAVFEHSGRGFCELFWDCREHGMAVSEWCEVVGQEHLDRAFDCGRGVLLATAHIGSWTMIPRWLTESGRPGASLLRYPSHHGAQMAMREMLPRVGLTGYGTPLKRSDVQACLTLLRRNGWLFIAADRRAHDVKLPFLGRPAWCATGTAALALRTGASIVPVHTVRVGAGHRIVFEPALEMTYSADRAEATTGITQALHDIFSRWIRANPEQWMWNHRRWRPRRRERRTDHS